MALIKCLEPGCTALVDTALACAEVNSLFGLRVILDHAIETNALSNVVTSKELQKHSDFIDDKIKKFGIPKGSSRFEMFKKKVKTDNGNGPVTISNLSIQCPKGHTHTYQVQCDD